MKKNSYDKYTYAVNGKEGFKLSQALRLWKTRYEKDFRDFERDVITHPGLYDFRDFVKEMWEQITPVTVEEALSQTNAEDRRSYFDAIGVEKLFKQLDPKLRDKQVIRKKRTRWDDKNDSYEYEFKDVYELYEIEGKKMFEVNQWGREPEPVYAVRCWCTTTNREYWLYVPREAATGRRWGAAHNGDYDAVRAIAWTIRIDVHMPERIYRQGDIIIVKTNDKTVFDQPQRHLTKEEYLQLMYSET